MNKYTSIFTLPFLIWIFEKNTIPVVPTTLTAPPQYFLPEKVDFNIHIKPILSDRCFKCHGPDKNKVEAGLQLTSFEGATARLKSGKAAVVPFKPNESELVKRILTKDPEDMMPTPKSNLSLNENEKQLLIKWIEQGAEYKEHWSFVVPFVYPVPKVAYTQWVRNSIDNFIVKKLEDNGLKPQAEASKETLIRRISLDLTGLPPTVEEVQVFVNDKSPDAYERLVDRLLATPQYGERMAMDWLDVARYADSHGYQDDGLRNAYPYRDWVIKAFNQNLPFNDFVTWQLAGDLLKNPTQDQLIATCFNRNHMQTQEGGVVDEEYRVEYVADRVGTFGKAFLGLTTECARCHTHKYDPITHTDYFSLYAFFNQNNDSGIVPYSGEATPTLVLKTPEAEKRLDSLNTLMKPYLATTQITQQYKKDFEKWLAEWGKKVGSNPTNTSDIANVDVGLGAYKRVVYLDFEKEDTTMNVDYVFPPSKKDLEKRDKDLAESKKDSTKKYNPPAKIWGFRNIETSDTMLKATNFTGDKDKRPKLVEGKFGNGLSFLGDAGMQMGRALDYDRNQPFSVSIWVKLMKAGEEGPIFGKTNGDAEGYRGWLCKLNKDGTLSFQLNHVWPDNTIDIQTVETLKVGEWTHIAMTYDGSSKANGVHIWVNGKTPEQYLWTDNLTKSLLHTRRNHNWNSSPFKFGMNTRETIQHTWMDELQIFKRQISDIEVLELYENKPLIINLLANQNRTEQEQKQLFDLFILRGGIPQYTVAIDSLTALRKKENLLVTDLEEVMIMTDRKEYRKTYILNRGAYDAPTTEVTIATPVKIFPFDDKKYPKNRLGLAQWLLDEKNPLFARVMVNRYWQMLFGKGLVATQEDFGNQGALPSHFELLDWLALDFRTKNWDLKAFVKQMVMSATYRQSSIPSVEATEKDNGNDLYSHYSANRLSAEGVRDNALAASGLLVKKIGGKSVYPYQPAGIWEALATRNATTYVQNHGDSLYRRSLYTIWKRSSPPPAMLNFDATDRSICMVRRQKTASPLQALVLMNDPQFVEASRLLAEKAIKTVPLAQNVERLEYIFQALTSRKPREKETAALKQLYDTQKTYYTQHPDKAEKLLNIGEYPKDAQLDKVEVAAYTIIASTVMNFDEFAMKR
jgi:hypothetical protein